MNKFLFYFLNCCVGIFLMTAGYAQSVNPKETEGTNTSPPYKWTDGQSIYQVTELKPGEGIARSFNVTYKENTYLLSFTEQDGKNELTISSGNLQLWSKKISLPATFRLGAVLVRGKQELWIKAAKNEPVHYKVKLSTSGCSVPRVKEHPR